MNNLKRNAKPMGMLLRKGGQGYEIYNRHSLCIDDVPTLDDVSFRLAHSVSIRQSNHEGYIRALGKENKKDGRYKNNK